MPDLFRITVHDTCTFITDHICVCVCSVLEDESTRLSAVELKQFIITGLRNLFGEVSSLT